MNMWFTSDTHFGHQNIIGYSGRPFKWAHEMDEFLIDQWNIYVKPQDHIYHLGDVTMDRSSAQKAAFIRLCKRLNGHKRLIMGNHDHYPVKVYLEAGFEKVMAMQRLDHYWFMHVPCHPSNVGSCKAVVHGHIHANPSPKPVLWADKNQVVHECRYINVCVEQTNYHPVDFDWIKAKAEE